MLDGRIYLIGGCELVIDAGGIPVDCVDSRRVDAYTPCHELMGGG
jgi:hypothetical protein